MSDSAPEAAGWPRVLYWWPVPDHDAGTEWYRVELPKREYSARGGQCSRSRDNVLAPESLSSADVIVGGYRRITPEYSKVWLELCERAEKRMVFDIDDNFFNAPPHFATSSPEFHAALTPLIRESHVVTVTTSALRDRLLEFNEEVQVVPNRVPLGLTELDRRQASERTVGWAGGISHEWDWTEVAPRVGRFLARNSGVGFHAMGSWDVINMTGWPGPPQVRTSPWRSDVEEYYKSIDFDIGVIPLTAHVFDRAKSANEFNRSKSAIKALEFAALGIPVVASAYGPYLDFVKHDETGFLVSPDRDRDWEKFLRVLAANPERRAEMGTNARSLARSHTVEGNLESWLEPWGVEVPPQS
jgi:glycosyltransferase involved in cell wall biosynthesis